jgi:preprotein translocase subunit SecA
MAKLNAVKAALGPASARYLMLIQIDNQWGMHLSAVESLKDEVYLRRYALMV